MRSRDVLAVFNRGRVSALALARTDVARVALSAEIQTNWMPRTLGSMMLRPGFQYLGDAAGDGAYIPFVFDIDDTAIIELSAGTLRVWDEGENLVTRASVSTTITNGEFTTDLAGWTDDDESGAASTWSSGAMQLLGTGATAAKRYQQVTVATADRNVVHALRINVTTGPAILRIGTTAGADDVVSQTVLREGEHSIAFVPTGNVYVQFSSVLQYPVLIADCTIESSGTVTLSTPWTTAEICKTVRWQQSSDVVFCAADGIQPYRIERRENNSWSIVKYLPDDGPFLTENTEPVTMTPSAISGNITVTASQPYFRSAHVGALLQITSQGQYVEADLSSAGAFTDPIRVVGVGVSRNYIVSMSGTWSGTITIQRSLGEPGSWVDIFTYTANSSGTQNDGLDNVEAYYRIGFKAGEYSSGTASVSLESASGSIVGTVRITGFNSTTEVDARVLNTLGGTDPTEIWAEGAWSDVQGWPQSVALWEGRLWWSGNGRNYASASDALSTFDPETLGDSAPINRLVGEGAGNRTNWLLPLARLVVGTASAEHSVRSTSFDEPVTPSNYNTKAFSTKGSARVPPTSADGRGYFIDRTEAKVFEMEYDAAIYGFRSTEMTLLCPELGELGFVRAAAQQTPDVRLHCIRSDGTAAVLVREAIEDVLCWVDVETDGVIEDVAVLPGELEDRVFYRVRRTIDGVTARYHEKWAREDQCRGGTTNMQADSFVTGTQAASTTIGGLTHLEGASVILWGDGADLGTYTVSSGAITASTAVANYVVGLPYTARFKSAKLAGQTALGLSLTQRKRIDHIGLIMADTHKDGLEFGPDFTTMDRLPLVENGAVTADGAIWESYDEDMISFPGEWDTDSRVCLRATAPRPCTVLAAVLNVDRQDKA